MQWICALGLVSTVALAGGGPRPGTSFEVHGHRGARALEPENTLPAFAHALNAGAHVLEADLGVSRDGVLVLNHDFHVNTTLCLSETPKLRTRVRPLVKDLNVAELVTYDCGLKADPEFPRRAITPGARLLRLRDLLQWLSRSSDPRARTVQLNLETKIDPRHPTWTITPKAFVDLLVQELRRNRFPLERVILQSFDFRTIIYSKRSYPGLRTSALVDKSSEADVLDVDKVWAQTRADYLSPNAHLLNSKSVERAQQLGMKVVPWTLNERRAWWYFLRMGVDGIITDDPAGLIRYLR